MHTEGSALGISNLRNLLRLPKVAPHLARLLSAGGIWTVNSDAAFGNIVKCRVEEVCFFFICFNELSVTPF